MSDYVGKGFTLIYAQEVLNDMGWFLSVVAMFDTSYCSRFAFYENSGVTYVT